MTTVSSPQAYEDFPVGRVIETGTVTVDRDEVLRFAAAYDPQRFHLDEEAARETVFKGLSASGWHTCGMVMRLVCDSYLLDSTSEGSPGIEKLRWLAPVRPGDTLQVKVTVTEARLMNSRPGLGLVRSRWEAYNQHGQRVLELDAWSMFGRRDAAPAAPALASSRQP